MPGSEYGPANGQPPSALELSWSGWGDPAQATALPRRSSSCFRGGLGVTRPTPRPALHLGRSSSSPHGCRRPARPELAAIVGEANARSDHETRARHALGRSAFDLLALRSGERIPAPDLVLYPGSHDEILAVLALCTRQRVAVVPFGGGTSVVGGLTPEADGFAGLVALDLRRLNALVALDQVSRIATFGPGLRGPEAEALLAPHGYTLGHFPQSFEYATLGGFAAARSSGQASAGYGRFDELVMALKVATPAGTLALGRAPRSRRPGPDLRQLILGCEGAFGVITEADRHRPAGPRAARCTRAGSSTASTAAFRCSSSSRRTRRSRPSCVCPTRPRRRSDWHGRRRSGRRAAAAAWRSSAGRVQTRRGGDGATAATIVLRDAGATAVPGAGDGWALRALPRSVPARRAARRGRAGRDARDGRVLVQRPARSTPRSRPRCATR